MSQSSLFESVWDQMALARNLTVASIDANADAVTYRVTFDLVLDR